MYRHPAMDAPDRRQETGGKKTCGIKFRHRRKSIESQRDTEEAFCRRRDILQCIHEQQAH